jgi:hypothetical protein
LAERVSFGLALLLLVTLVLITLRRWRRATRLEGFLAIPLRTLIRLGGRIVNGIADRGMLKLVQVKVRPG